MGPALYTLTGGGRLPDPDPASPAPVFFLPTVSFHQLQWAPLDMEAPLSGTPEARWRASSLVGLLSETCEAGWRAPGLVGSLSGTCETGWRASSLVGSGYGGSATNDTPGTVRRGGRRRGAMGDVGAVLPHDVLSATLAG